MSKSLKIVKKELTCVSRAVLSPDKKNVDIFDQNEN